MLVFKRELLLENNKCMMAVKYLVAFRMPVTVLIIFIRLSNLFNTSNVIAVIFLFYRNESMFYTKNSFSPSCYRHV